MISKIDGKLYLSYESRFSHKHIVRLDDLVEVMTIELGKKDEEFSIHLIFEDREPHEIRAEQGELTRISDEIAAHFSGSEEAIVPDYPTHVELSRRWIPVGDETLPPITALEELTAERIDKGAYDARTVTALVDLSKFLLTRLGFQVKTR